jgi:AcrR family transcriptional regulator
VAQIKKAEVREAILKCAYRLFKRKGYVSTTTAQIAAGARISEANLYVYFKSKFEILYGLFEPWLRERIGRLEERVAKERAPRAKVRLLLSALWRELPSEDNGFTHSLMQALSTFAARDKYRLELRQWVEERIEAMLLAAVPTERHARLTRGSFAHVLIMAQDGFAMHLHMKPATPCSEATIELFCDLVLGSETGKEK